MVLAFADQMIKKIINRDSDNWRDREAYRYRAMSLADRGAATVDYLTTTGVCPLCLGWAIIHAQLYPQFRWVNFGSVANS